MDLRSATLKAVSFYLLHNVSTLNQWRKSSCGTVMCKYFASYQGYPNYRWNLIRYLHTAPCFTPAFVDQNLSRFNSQIVWNEHIPEPFARYPRPGMATLRGLHLHQHTTRHSADLMYMHALSVFRTHDPSGLPGPGVFIHATYTLYSVSGDYVTNSGKDS
jgi:hypothetical protein